jgi:hypothetical protein
MSAVHRFLDDWGVFQALFQLALAIPVFAAVEYALGRPRAAVGGGRVPHWPGRRVLLRLAGAEAASRIVTASPPTPRG